MPVYPGARISRFSRMKIPHMHRFSDRAGSARRLAHNATSDVAFRRHDNVGTPITPISRLNSWPVRTPIQRFAAPSRVANAWLGATVDRYSFGVGLFHPLLHAGLSRRFPWLVIESVPERLELKQEIFAQLESAAPRDAILSSNSSSYASRLIVAGLSTTDRMLNTHFYMPPTQIAVDVMSCGNTSQEVLDFVLDTFPEYGLRPFLVRCESTGFIFNRIWAAIKREALDVVAGGSPRRMMSTRCGS